MLRSRTVLVVSADDRSRADYVSLYRSEGIEAHGVPSLDPAECGALSDLVDLIVIVGRVHGSDVMHNCAAPDQGTKVPTILLTPETDLSDQILALEIGVDEVLHAPVDPRLLLAKSRAILRRVAPAAPSVTQSGLWSVDTTLCEIRAPSGVVIAVPPLQSKLMQLLVRKSGQLVTYEEMRPLLEPGAVAQNAALRTAMSRLRELLKRNGDVDPIRTARGAGYIFEP